MAPAEEGSYGRKREPSPDRSHRSPLQDSRSLRENQDGEGRGGRHHYSSDTDSEPHKDRTGRERAYSPARRGSLHRADENLQKRRNEGDVSRLDDVSGGPRHQKQDIDDVSGHHSQRKRDVHDVLLDQRRRSPDIDDAVGDPRLRRQDVNNMSRDHRRVDDTLGDHRQKGGAVHDVLGDCSREREGADDILGDSRQRRRDVDDVFGNPRRRRQEVDDVSGDQRRRRWDVDSLPGDSSGRRQDVEVDLDNCSLRRQNVDDVPDRSRRQWDVDDVLDNVSQKRQDLDDVLGDKNRRRHDVDTLVGDNSQRRRNLDDAPGDSRRRREVDDDHCRRRRDVDDTFDDRRSHERGGRDYQRRSPHRTSSVHDRRGGNEERDGRSRQVQAALSGDKAYDGQRRRRTMDNDGRSGLQRDMEDDRFSARFRNAGRDENELPELFSVHRGKVQSVRPFGIFVRLEGYYKQGLVHLSQLSDHEVTDREDSDERKVQAIAAVAGEGDQVWVKVISLKDDGGSVKIGCSLKLVSQSTGKDLDPNNVKLDQQQPKENRQGPRKVTLDAIYNVVCSRCGGHGHLKTECYGMANKSYELLPDEDDDLTEQPPQPSQPSQAQMLSGEVSIKPGFGRGRAMVLPAWMTHGSGANGIQQLGSEPEKQKKKRKASELPDKAMTVEEAMALIAQVKKEKKDKHHRKEHKKHKKEKKLKHSSKKESSSRKDRG